MIAVAVMGAATLWLAVQSDRIGRRRLCMASALLAALWAFPMFWLIDTRNPLLITLGMTGGLLCFAMLYGPMGAFLPELFRVRFPLLRCLVRLQRERHRRRWRQPARGHRSARPHRVERGGVGARGGDRARLPGERGAAARDEGR
jgi:hypothetical protein